MVQACGIRLAQNSSPFHDVQAIAVGKEFFADFEIIAKAYFRKAKALAKLNRWQECVEAYDEGLLSFRDPATVKLRNQVKKFFFLVALNPVSP